MKKSKLSGIFGQSSTAVVVGVAGLAQRAVRTLDRLKKMRVYLSIDDFGTGHSSLAGSVSVRH